jgi:hypothetical protein
MNTNCEANKTKYYGGGMPALNNNIQNEHEGEIVDGRLWVSGSRIASKIERNIEHKMEK